MKNEITNLEGFTVGVLDGRGVAIVGPSDNYWLVYPHDVCVARKDQDALATAYCETLK